MTRFRDHFEVMAAEIVRRAVIATFAQAKVGYKGEQRDLDGHVVAAYEDWAEADRRDEPDSMVRDEYRASVLQALRSIGFCLME